MADEANSEKGKERERQQVRPLLVHLGLAQQAPPRVLVRVQLGWQCAGAR
jgi:hypothetical protein